MDRFKFGVIMYKKYKDSTTGQDYLHGIKRTTDNAYIPFDQANTDYQEYLAWLAEGNTPEEAE